MKRAYVPLELVTGLYWVCPDCGVLVVSRDAHDRWHESLEEKSDER